MPWTVKPAETAVAREHSANVPIAGQQLRNMQQWGTWEAVFSSWPMPMLHYATIKELLEAVFSVCSMPRLCNKGQLPWQKSPETEIRRVRGWYEIDTGLWGCKPKSRGSFVVGKCYLVTQWRPWPRTLVCMCVWGGARTCVWFVKCSHELFKS
jgi:hypothetical protein